MEKCPRKDRWEYIDVIPLLSLLGVYHCNHLLHMCRKFVYINITNERINKVAIGYMINPKLLVNKVFREQVKKCWGYIFYKDTM